MRLVSLSDSCQIVLILNEIVNTGRFEYPGSTCTLGLSLQNPYHYKIPQLGPPPCVPPAGATTTSRWGQYCVWDHHQFLFLAFLPLFWYAHTLSDTSNRIRTPRLHYKTDVKTTPLPFSHKLFVICCHTCSLSSGTHCMVLLIEMPC